MMGSTMQIPSLTRYCHFALCIWSGLSWARPQTTEGGRGGSGAGSSADLNTLFSGSGSNCPPGSNGLTTGNNSLTWPNGTVKTLPSETFYTFPDNWQPESVKQRTNGALLVTINSKPLLYQVDPTKNQSGDVLAEFQGYTSLFGITESGIEDIFFLITNNFTGNPDFLGINGTNSIWAVDLRGVGTSASTAASRQLLESQPAKVKKLVDIPAAGLLDGLTLLNANLNLLLTGDAQSGTLWLIDAPNKNATAIFQHESMAGTSNAPNSSLQHVGINGIKYTSTGSANQLFWTNTAKGEFWRMPINPSFPSPVNGTPVLVERLGEGNYLDEFTIDGSGNAFICEPLKGVRFRAAVPSGPGQDSAPLVVRFNANSNTFGRLSTDTQNDKCTMYVTVNGRVDANSPPPMNAPPSLAKVDTTALGICNRSINTIQAQSPC